MSRALTVFVVCQYIVRVVISLESKREDPLIHELFVNVPLPLISRKLPLVKGLALTLHYSAVFKWASPLRSFARSSDSFSFRLNEMEFSDWSVVGEVFGIIHNDSYLSGTFFAGQVAYSLTEILSTTLSAIVQQTQLTIWAAVGFESVRKWIIKPESRSETLPFSIDQNILHDYLDSFITHLKEMGRCFLNLLENGPMFSKPGDIPFNLKEFEFCTVLAATFNKRHNVNAETFPGDTITFFSSLIKNSVGLITQVTRLCNIIKSFTGGCLEFDNVIMDERIVSQWNAVDLRDSVGLHFAFLGSLRFPAIRAPPAHIGKGRLSGKFKSRFEYHKRIAIHKFAWRDDPEALACVSLDEAEELGQVIVELSVKKFEFDEMMWFSIHEVVGVIATVLNEDIISEGIISKQLVESYLLYSAFATYLQRSMIFNLSPDGLAITQYVTWSAERYKAYVFKKIRMRLGIIDSVVTNWWLELHKASAPDLVMDYITEVCDLVKVMMVHLKNAIHWKLGSAKSFAKNLQYLRDSSKMLIFESSAVASQQLLLLLTLNLSCYHIADLREEVFRLYLFFTFASRNEESKNINFLPALRRDESEDQFSSSLTTHLSSLKRLVEYRSMSTPSIEIPRESLNSFINRSIEEVKSMLLIIRDHIQAFQIEGSKRLSLEDYAFWRNYVSQLEDLLLNYLKEIGYVDLGRKIDFFELSEAVRFLVFANNNVFSSIRSSEFLVSLKEKLESVCEPLRAYVMDRIRFVRSAEEVQSTDQVIGFMSQTVDFEKWKRVSYVFRSLETALKT